MNASNLAEIILDESGYTTMWQNDESIEAEGRLENLKELGYAKRADDAQKNLDRYMKEQNEKLDNLSQK